MDGQCIEEVQGEAWPETQVTQEPIEGLQPLQLGV